MNARLAVVTATLDLDRADDCVHSWLTRAAQAVDLYLVGQIGRLRDWEQLGPPSPGHGHHVYATHARDILGVVPAFALGVQRALDDGAQLIAAFHDDLLIEQDGWDEDVVRLFKACPRAGLCGFGGGKGLGADDIYQTPYNPMQLARQRFISNMRDAEAHGERCEVAMPVAALDGFSQIGLADFWRGRRRYHPDAPDALPIHDNLLREMADWGIVHHAFDSALGAWALRLQYQTWFLPVKCHHYGGVTAAGDPRYQAWANAYAQSTDTLDGIAEEGTGDQIFWLRSHRLIYDRFRDVLPIRT